MGDIEAGQDTEASFATSPSSIVFQKRKTKGRFSASQESINLDKVDFQLLSKNNQTQIYLWKPVTWCSLIPRNILLFSECQREDSVDTRKSQNKKVINVKPKKQRAKRVVSSDNLSPYERLSMIDRWRFIGTMESIDPKTQNDSKVQMPSKD